MAKSISKYIPKFGRDNEAIRSVWLKNTLQSIPTGARILDAGAGELLQKRFCEHLEYVAQDFGQYEGKGDGKGLQTGSWNQSHLDIVSDITDIPEPNNSFDAIMCIEVLEHLPNPVLAIEEFSRLIKPNGTLVITAPFCSLTHFAPFHYSSGFNRYFYEKHLIENGFIITELEANGSYFEFLAQELWRLPRVAKVYSGVWLLPFVWLVVLLVMPVLFILSKSDKRSNELLNYGFHVKAKKK